jgi:hypothetical protein
MLIPLLLSTPSAAPTLPNRPGRVYKSEYPYWKPREKPYWEADHVDAWDEEEALAAFGIEID